MSDKTFEKLEEGNRVLFNERKIPLKVENVDENRLHVSGPQGGEYIMFPAEEKPELILIANKGSREYASKVENLREVGVWEKINERKWRHSKSGEEIELMKNDAGFWTIETGLEADVPKYGFSSEEHAREEIKKLVEDNPEG